MSSRKADSLLQRATVPSTLVLVSLTSCLLLSTNRWQRTHTLLSHTAKPEIKRNVAEADILSLLKPNN